MGPGRSVGRWGSSWKRLPSQGRRLHSAVQTEAGKRIDSAARKTWVHSSTSFAVSEPPNLPL